MAARTEKTTEMFIANIENGKRNISRLKADLDSAVRSLISLDKKYIKAKKALARKAKNKNLARLSGIEAERAMAAASVRDADARVDGVLVNIEREYAKLSEYYLSVGYRRDAKKATRELDKFTKHHVKDMEKIMSGAVAILETISEDTECEDELPVRPELSESFEQPTPAATVQRRVEASINVAPINIDVSATVEAAVSEAMKKLSLTLDKKIEEYVSSLTLPEIPVAPVAPASVQSAPETVATAPTSAPELAAPCGETLALRDVDPEGAKKIITTVNILGELVKRLDEICELAERLTERANGIFETQRVIFESQRTATRDIEGVQVKQRLVNEEQAALIEAQEIALQHERLISESHSKLADEQSKAVELLNSVIAMQNALEASLKESIQSQKITAQTASKNMDMQKAIADKQKELGELIRLISDRQRQNARRITPRKKNADAQPEESAPKASELVVEAEEIIESADPTVPVTE